MAYIYYDTLCRSAFYKNFSVKDRWQDNNLNYLIFETNDAPKKEEKITINFAPPNDEGVVNKTYLDAKLTEVNGHVT